MYIGMYILHVVFIFCIYVYTRVCGQIKGAAWGHICHRHKIQQYTLNIYACMYVCEYGNRLHALSRSSSCRKTFLFS